MKKCKRLCMMLLAVIVMITGSLSAPWTTESVQAAAKVQHMTRYETKAMLSFASKQMNKPYVWGACGPNAFDCSGFVYYVMKNYARGTSCRSVDTNLLCNGAGRSTFALYHYYMKNQGKVYHKDNASAMDGIKPGSIILFFSSGTPSSIKNGTAKPQHAAIYVGKKWGQHMVIHCGDNGVKMIPITSMGYGPGLFSPYFLAFEKVYGTIKVKSVSGAWYSLYRSNGSFVKKVKAVNGVATLKRVEADDSYIVKQTTAPAGYKKNTTKYRVKQTEILNATKTFTVRNSKAYGYIKTSVKSSASKAGIAGVKVLIKHKHVGKWSKGTVVKTDKHGNATLKVWLHPSYLYSVTEVQSAEGYSKNSSSQYVYAKSITSGKSKTFFIQNTPIQEKKQTEETKTIEE